MTTILRWTLHRGGLWLTCAVEATQTSSFDVCVLPHWDLSASTVEHFTDAASALRRHAEIALHLREAGWMTDYGHRPVARGHGHPGMGAAA